MKWNDEGLRLWQYHRLLLIDTPFRSNWRSHSSFKMWIKTNEAAKYAPFPVCPIPVWLTVSLCVFFARSKTNLYIFLCIYLHLVQKQKSQRFNSYACWCNSNTSFELDAQNRALDVSFFFLLILMTFSYQSFCSYPTPKLTILISGYLLLLLVFWFSTGEKSLSPRSIIALNWCVRQSHLFVCLLQNHGFIEERSIQNFHDEQWYYPKWPAKGLNSQLFSWKAKSITIRPTFHLHFFIIRE